MWIISTCLLLQSTNHYMKVFNLFMYVLVYNVCHPIPYMFGSPPYIKYILQHLVHSRHSSEVQWIEIKVLQEVDLDKFISITILQTSYLIGGQRNSSTTSLNAAVWVNFVSFVLNSTIFISFTFTLLFLLPSLVNEVLKNNWNGSALCSSLGKTYY